MDTPRSEASETRPSLEWHKFKDTWVGLEGDKVICIIERMDGMPCEMYGLNITRGVFTTAEAAKTHIEQAAERYEEDQKEPPKKSERSFYVDILRSIILRSMLAALDPPPKTANATPAEAEAHAGGQ